VSKGFEGLPLPERLGLVQREWMSEEDLQALVYTPEEFSEVSKRLTMKSILSYAREITSSRSRICTRCGRRGSPQVKIVKNRLGRRYPYQYYAHYDHGKVKWCYIPRRYQSW